MASLKSFLPSMALLFGTTADALYSRQRALVDLGVLKFVGSRGPGSGTPLDGSGVAGLVIAMLVADTLHDVDQRVRDLCLAAPKDGLCPWTGEADLQSALAAVLVSPEKADNLISFSVYRHDNRAILGYEPFGSESEFISSAPESVSTLKIMSYFDGGDLWDLAVMLQDEMAGAK